MSTASQMLRPYKNKCIAALLVIVSASVISACSQKNDESVSESETKPAAEQKVPALEFASAYMPELPPGRDVGVIYFKLKNNTAKNYMLTYVHTPIAKRVEVHQHLHSDGMMKMRSVPHFSVSPNMEMSFKPGGFHLMVFGVDAQPEAGEEFPVSFEFAGLPPITIKVLVKKPS